MKRKANMLISSFEIVTDNLEFSTQINLILCLEMQHHKHLNSSFFDETAISKHFIHKCSLLRLTFCVAKTSTIEKCCLNNWAKVDKDNFGIFVYKLIHSFNYTYEYLKFALSLMER